jgi:hypothetical protein
VQGVLFRGKKKKKKEKNLQAPITGSNMVIGSAGDEAITEKIRESVMDCGAINHTNCPLSERMKTESVSTKTVGAR